MAQKWCLSSHGFFDVRVRFLARKSLVDSRCQARIRILVRWRWFVSFCALSVFTNFSVLFVYYIFRFAKLPYEVCLPFGQCSSVYPLLDAVLYCFAWCCLRFSAQSPILPFQCLRSNGGRQSERKLIESCKVRLDAFTKAKKALREYGCSHTTPLSSTDALIGASFCLCRCLSST